MLDKLKISQKIYLLGMSQLALMLIMGLVSLGQMNKIGVELVDIAEKDVPLNNAITQITVHKLEQAIAFESILLQAAFANNGQQSAKAKMLSQLDSYSALDKKIMKEIKDTEAFIATSIDTLHSEEAKTEFRRVLSSLKTIDEHYVDLNELVNNILTLLRSGDYNAVFMSTDNILEAEHKLEKELVTLSEKVAQFTLKSTLQAEHDEQVGIKWMAIVFVIAVLFGSVAPYFISRAISLPVIKLQQSLKDIADGDGDLTVKLPEASKDETGDVARAFNHFIAKLRDLIAGTNKHAVVLGESSETALQVMQTTLRNVEQQYSETEQVASAVNQMSATTQEVANNANSAAKVTENVSSNVVSGREEALETQAIISQLTEEVDEASNVIQALVTETNKIGSVLDNIQGIAEQTNLLALNAAIEAARAGESGRGFAVVADEVRSLAQRTQTSTVDIQELVTRLQNEAKNAVSSMDKGSESAQLCLEKATSTAQTFEKAAESVGQISSLNIQIAAAAEQQSMVAEEINKNLTRIKDVAETTTEGARKTEQANLSIAKSLVDLHTSLNVFQT